MGRRSSAQIEALATCALATGAAADPFSELSISSIERHRQHLDGHSVEQGKGRESLPRRRPGIDM